METTTELARLKRRVESAKETAIVRQSELAKAMTQAYSDGLSIEKIAEAVDAKPSRVMAIIEGYTERDLFDA